MQQNSRIAGYSMRYGTVSSLIHIPISGRFKTISIRLPIHMLTINPQNSDGLLVITCGPGWMLWIVIAPTISAITALGGMPSVSSGMNEVCAAALLADSGPATPWIAPLPNCDGSLATFFSRPYAAKDESNAPPPGRMPRSEPTMVPRMTAGKESFASCLVGQRRDSFS